MQLTSPTVKPVNDVQCAAQANGTRDLPSVVSYRRSPDEQHHANDQYYPESPPEVRLDTIKRLRAPILQHCGALVAQSRDMRKCENSPQWVKNSVYHEFQTQSHRHVGDIRCVDDALTRLQHEMQGIRELVESISRDIHAMRRERQAVSAQGSVFELLVQQNTRIPLEANKNDTPKSTTEITTNKTQEFKDADATGLTPASMTHAYQSPRKPPAPLAHADPSNNPTPSTSRHKNTPVHPTQRPPPFRSRATPSTAATPELSTLVEPIQCERRVTVNAGTKRTHPSHIHSPHVGVTHPVLSAKRSESATIEPRAGDLSLYTHPSQLGYDQRTNEESDARTQTHSHPDSTGPWQHPVFVSYSTHDARSDDSWSPELWHTIEDHARERSHGRGPGSRSERSRKSMVAQVHSSRTPNAHTKKSRVKPTRNADGILIRKDGQPDRRSQSSAANLRKFHARKEKQKGSERRLTSADLPSAIQAAPSTPIPSDHPHFSRRDLTASIQKKHTTIMDKIFPEGLDESRKQQDYARRVFTV